MKAISENDRKKIRVVGLAEKHNCTVRYINKLLDGTRKVNSPLAKAIMDDVKSIIKLLSPTKTNNQ